MRDKNDAVFKKIESVRKELDFVRDSALQDVGGGNRFLFQKMAIILHLLHRMVFDYGI